jgi:uncharacterized protein (DUF1800 family)
MKNQKKIQHLYWRAGFGLPPQAIHQKDWAPEKVVKKMMQEAKKVIAIPVPTYKIVTEQTFKKMTPKQKKEQNKELRELTKTFNANWVKHMVQVNSSPLLEKMSLFWHGHFACESKRVDFAAKQLNTIRTNALGNFRDLVVGVSKDAAMIMYLNNQQNKKKSPNENYARELMELFTIGRGNYTEKDIKEAARAFTGWSANRQTGDFEFRKRQHDEGEKTFMGQTGVFDGEDIIDIILDQKETAVFIVTKIYRYFVNEVVDEKRVAELANTFFSSNYDIGGLMQKIFTSSWFYAEKNMGTKIKSPIEFLVGLAKVLDIKFKAPESVVSTQYALGQVLFRPPNVAGWPGGKAWIDNATLMLRMNMAAIAFDRAEMNIRFKDESEQKKKKRMNKLKIEASIKGLQKLFGSKEIDVQGLADYLLPSPILTKNTFVEELAQYTASDQDRFKFNLLGIMSLPEYQMC